MQIDETIIDTALANRLGSTYTLEEIERVTNLSRRVFPPDVDINEETLERFRALARLSQIQLRPASQIKSHRKLIGPIIVFFKKLTFPFIQVHLKQPFEGLEEFASGLVYSLAKEVVEVERLKKNDQPIA